MRCHIDTPGCRRAQLQLAVVAPTAPAIVLVEADETEDLRGQLEHAIQMAAGK